MRKSNWNLNLSLEDARRNNEIVSLAESSTIRFIDEINGTDSDEVANKIKQLRKDLKFLLKKERTKEIRVEIANIYKEIDEFQFIPEYFCLVVDKNSDYLRACEGFIVNNITYKRLLGTPGGIKNGTVVFLADKNYDGKIVCDEVARRLDNGRNMKIPLVPAKFEAYKSLACSASIPVSDPNGVLVISDCITHFNSDYILLDDECDGEPQMTHIKDGEVEQNCSDGYGLISPLLAERWSYELGEDELVSGFCIRNSFCKGMVFPFDYIDFGNKVSGSFIVKDAWGYEKDIRNVEIILTTSMLKLWDSYSSIDDYLNNCKINKYSFSVTKTCEIHQRNSRELNYQFLQSYELSDNEIRELIQPSMDDICGVLGGDFYKTILFLKGKKQTQEILNSYENDFAKALMVDSSVVDDPVLRGRVNQMLQKRINNAKLGRVRVDGDYSVVSGDPYALCQSMFNLPITGLLKAGQVYSLYWNKRCVNEIVCFRAPMSCHNNIRKMFVVNDSQADYWYKYMKTTIIINAWDTLPQAANGLDFDGDLIFSTNNNVLLKNTKNLPAIFCVQRKAQKKIVTEDDLIQSNMASFGDDIGSITNKVTAMFEVQSKFEKGSLEYETLNYRIMCGQLYQQNAIDKAKGIVAKSMPKYWYNLHKSNKVDKLNTSIVASKSPYFMNYRYPQQKAEYTKYIVGEESKCFWKFNKSIKELSSIDSDNEFIRWHYTNMPVGIGSCTMNKLCIAVENYIALQKSVWRENSKDFNYLIYRNEDEYSKYQYREIKNIYDNYHSLWETYVKEAKRVHLHTKDIAEYKKELVYDTKKDLQIACEDADVLCNILLDLTYGQKHGNQFVWDICGSSIIKNLMNKNGGKFIYLTNDDLGDIEYCGDNFMVNEFIEKENEDKYNT